MGNKKSTTAKAEAAAKLAQLEAEETELRRRQAEIARFRQEYLRRLDDEEDDMEAITRERNAAAARMEEERRRRAAADAERRRASRPGGVGVGRFAATSAFRAM